MWKSWFYIFILLVLTALLIRKIRYVLMENEVWDKLSEEKIKALHPLARDKARGFINAVEQKLGIKLRVVDGYRPFARQQDYYNQPTDGIDNDNDGQIDEPDEKITNARPGYSYHNFGLAFDVVPIIGGKATYNLAPGVWERIAAVAKRFGFIWGGSFKSIVDKPHFEMHVGKDLAQLRELYAARKVDAGGYVYLT